MKHVKNYLSLLVIVLSVLLISCEDDSFDPNATGEIIFGFSTESIKSKSVNEPSAIILSMHDDEEDSVFINERIDLLKMNDEYITAPIALTVGIYELTDFIVVDSENNVLYISPKEGSKQAYLVQDPLSIDYTLGKDDVLKIAPEVLSVRNHTPEDFGYNTFGFNLVETIDFLIATFVYNIEIQNFELTDANITIQNSSNIIYSGTLDPITNLIRVSGDYDDYEVNISKDGFGNFSETFTKDSLIKHFTTPLSVILSNSSILILQPGPDDGKDAYLVNRTNNNGINTNYGNHPGFIAKAWTALGEPTISRSLIDFDLSSIPSESTITNAQLFLYAVDNASNGAGHSQLSGSNEGYLQRVTSSWDEMTVTWNTQPTTTELNQVYIPASENDMQNYQIDITVLIKDILNNPEESYGLLIRQISDDYYRRLQFGSSDNSIVSKRPKLVIEYE